MRSGLIRFKHSSRGYVAVMKSAGVRDDLGRRAQNVKQSVESSAPHDRYWDLIADTNTGRNRAGATVIGVPMRVEVKDRLLGRALDAAG